MSDSDSPVLTSQLPKSQDHKFQLVLKNVLKQSGVILSLGEDPNILKQEQSLVVRDLEKNFSKLDAPLKEFIRGLEAFCKKEKYFKKALASSVLRRDGDSYDESHMDIEQESLVRIFLKTNQIQKYMIEILLNEIMAVAPEAVENTQHLHLLLTPLRYLPYIINPQELATRLLDILEIATFPSQLEILDSLPDIMPDSQYEETAKQLCKLMDDNDELTGATIDCLNALELDAEIKIQVRDTILAKITGGTNLKVFPVLLSFLMSDCKSNNILPTLMKIRNALDMMMSTSEDSKEQESCRIVIFNKLHMYAISPKIVSESWMNMISGIRSHNDHKPIDYLLLFMLHSKAHLKKRIIELTFRKRVQSGLFKIKLLEKMFQEYMPQQLLKEYFESIVRIGCYLLRSSNDQIVIEFACTLFQSLFNHSYTEPIYRREVLEALVILTCSVEQKKIINILRLLSSFLVEKLILQQHAVLLMRLLEKLDSFSLRDLKEVFEILCSLTCGEDADDSMSGLRDEIHMIVRKQLHSTKKSIKLRGIISAVVMARHIALVSEDRDIEVPKGILSINQLPRGAAKDAAAILELTNASISGCPELIGLYYDQLAAMLLPNTYFEPYFLAWLHDTSTVNFNEKYLIDTVPNAVNDIAISSQYALNRSDEMYELVRVNIAGLTLSNDTSVQLLAPHFRLLRLLNYRQQNGDLSSIDALLGSPVILPNVDDFEDLDSDQVKEVADCLFHCANWFRELVSGFVTQKSKKIRAKVAQRLQDLIEMEEKLNKCLVRCTDHKLPCSYFDSVHELNRTVSPAKKDIKARNPRKKLKTNNENEHDETAVTTQSNTQAVSKKKKLNSKSFDNENEIKFREMDTDILLLLKYPLKLMDEQLTQPTQTATLSLDQLKFILKDFVSKVSVLIQGKDVGLSQLNMIVPIHVIADGTVLLPNLNRHLQDVVKKISKILEATDGRTDMAELFTEECLGLKACFGLIIEIFYLMFSWAGFQHHSNLELLKKLLISLRDAESQTPLSANRLVSDCITSFTGYTAQCLEISQGVHLIKTMEVLYSITTPSNDIQKKIVSAAGKLLAKRWYNHKGALDSGKNYNSSVDTLIKVYLSGVSAKIICGFVGKLQEQADMLKTKEDCLPMMSCIDKQCFHIFYNALCTSLLKRVKSEVEALTNSEHLQLWEITTLAMQGLMSIAKVKNTKAVLGSFLKKSIEILKVFLSHGIPIMELTLRSKPDEVVKIFKNLQISTRFLHHLCCYSKFMKDSSLVAFVPKFRMILETLVYRVKATLVANNCSDAFWMGNLRNKDLEGEDILSQSSATENDVQQDEDEELPEDDTDMDDSEDETTTERNTRGSEAYD